MRLEVASAFLFAFICSFCTAQFVDIAVPGLGTCRGSRTKVFGVNVDGFKGLPYAQPPVGALRFQPPKYLSWTGLKNTTTYGPVCPQMNSYTGKMESGANEDCLTLNIFKPSQASGAFPVMFWIHGGSYTTGTGGHVAYDGSTLAAMHNVIVVTINYRLGILGFFNVPGTSTRGNYGMLDQIAALRWVKKNIRSFGGDPNKVTIAGISAGATSVSLLTVSPLITKDKLFIRAIQESGVASCPWAVYVVKTNTVAKLFGASLGCNDVTTLVSCLRGKTPAEIISKQSLLNAKIHTLRTPIVDNHFLTSLPWDLEKKNQIETGSVEHLIGYTQDDGSMFTMLSQQLSTTPKLATESTFKQIIQYYTSGRYPGKQDLLNNAVFYEYTKYAQISKELKWFESSSEFATDYFFASDAINFADAMARKGKTVYFYKFSFLSKYLRFPAWKVAHGMEVGFVFGTPFSGGSKYFHLNFTAEDRIVSKNVMDLWTGFVKYGNPGNNWPKYNQSQKLHLNIGFNLTSNRLDMGRRVAFWNSLVPQLANATWRKDSNKNAVSSTFRAESMSGYMMLFLLFNVFWLGMA